MSESKQKSQNLLEDHIINLSKGKPIKFGIIHNNSNSIHCMNDLKIQKNFLTTLSTNNRLKKKKNELLNLITNDNNTTRNGESINKNDFSKIKSLTARNSKFNCEKNYNQNNLYHFLKKLEEQLTQFCTKLINQYNKKDREHMSQIFQDFKYSIKKINNDSNSASNIENWDKIIYCFFNIIKNIIKIKINEIKNEYQSKLLLLEKSNRYYIQQIFLKQTKIEILEGDIDSYMEMEEEFEKMKVKLKYENGKFMQNDKKENEIFILRAENSNLKKIIDENEKTIEKFRSQKEKKEKKSMIKNNTIEHFGNYCFSHKPYNIKHSHNDSQMNSNRNSNTITNKIIMNHNFAKRILSKINSPNHNKVRCENLTKKILQKQHNNLLSNKIINNNHNKAVNIKKIKHILKDYQMIEFDEKNSELSSNINSKIYSNNNNIHSLSNIINKSFLTYRNLNNNMSINKNPFDVNINSIEGVKLIIKPGSHPKKNINNNNSISTNSHKKKVSLIQKRLFIKGNNSKGKLNKLKKNFTLVQKNNKNIVKLPLSQRNNSNVGINSSIAINYIIQNNTLNKTKKKINEKKTKEKKTSEKKNMSSVKSSNQITVNYTLQTKK